MKNSIKHITQVQLEEMFLNFKKDVSLTGVNFLSVMYQSAYRLSKQKKGVKLVSKISNVAIMVGADYTKRINKILVKQGDEAGFEAKKMSGKSYTNGKENPVVHADKNPDFKMLVMMTKKGISRNNVYLYNGEVITIKQAEEMDLLTPKHYEQNESTPTVGRGQVDEENDFDIQTLGFDKIKQITINSTDYIIIK